MKKVIATDKAPSAIGPYSQGIAASGKMVFVSGQIPIDPATGAFAVKDLPKGALVEIEAIAVKE